jgi:Cyclic nucleotide-binding domain
MEPIREGRKLQNLCGHNTDPVRHRGIRSVLSEEQWCKLENCARRKTFRAGEIVFVEDDIPTHSFIVLSGVLKLTKIHPDGERYVTGLMFRNDLLCGMFKSHQTCSAEAATDLELCAIPLQILSNLAAEAPALEQVLFRAALSELVERAIAHFKGLAKRGGKLAGQRVCGVIAMNGIRIVLEDGTWGLICAAPDKPELVVAVDSPVSEASMRALFAEIDAHLSTYPEVAIYN